MFMRRLNDVKKVADFIVSNFKSSQFDVTKLTDNSYDVVVPYLPSTVVTMVSSDIRIGVFPMKGDSVLCNVYKL